MPLGELRVEVMTDYVGRNAGHFSAHLMAGGMDVARFTAPMQRDVELVLPEGLPGHPLPRLEPLAHWKLKRSVPSPTDAWVAARYRPGWVGTDGGDVDLS